MRSVGKWCSGLVLKDRRLATQCGRLGMIAPHQRANCVHPGCSRQVTRKGLTILRPAKSLSFSVTTTQSLASAALGAGKLTLQIPALLSGGLLQYRRFARPSMRLASDGRGLVLRAAFRAGVAAGLSAGCAGGGARLARALRLGAAGAQAQEECRVGNAGSLQKGKETTRAPLGRLAAIGSLRQSLDDRPATAPRQLIVSGDGSYTNKTVLRNLPPRTTFIGRIRKDAKLHLPLLEQDAAVGRPRLYGPQAPTPQQILDDDSIPVVHILCFAAGELREIPVKVYGPYIGARPGWTCRCCWWSSSRWAIVCGSAPSCSTASRPFWSAPMSTWTCRYWCNPISSAGRSSATTAMKSRCWAWRRGRCAVPWP